jgi:hypothetical protein
MQFLWGDPIYSNSIAVCFVDPKTIGADLVSERVPFLLALYFWWQYTMFL